LISRGFEVNKDKIHREIMERDVRDSGRDIAPLKQAADAHLIDSTGLSIDTVFRQILDIIKKDVHEK
jgi:cytidylate kinase